MRFDALIQDIMSACKVHEYTLAWSGGRNFRYRVLPTYKHNRASKEKPALHSVLKAYALENHPTVMWEGIEADDTMGILSTQESGKYVICSIDKDLKQIPGWLYNWNKQGRPRWVDRREAHHWFMYQTLVGDTADGYKGCPGMGDKRTTKLLEDTPEDAWWEAVVECYQKKQLTEKDAIQQARVSRMLTAKLWNQSKQKPILWKPGMDW